MSKFEKPNPSDLLESASDKLMFLHDVLATPPEILSNQGVSGLWRIVGNVKCEVDCARAHERQKT